MKTQDVYDCLKHLQSIGFGERELKVSVTPEDVRPIIWISEWFSRQSCWMSVRTNSVDAIMAKHGGHHSINEALDEINPLVDTDDGNYGDSEFYVIVGDNDVRKISCIDLSGIQLEQV